MTYAETGDTSGRKDLLERAKKCFKQACAAEAKQRERERDDLRFQIPEYQWTDAARAERAGGNGVPARPILSISKLDQPIQLVINQARQSHLGVNIHPVSEKASKETAEVLQGLYRRIERDSNAQQARLWAFQRAVIAGRGWYRINSKWDEDSDPQYFDQEIIIERILHQDSVYADPSAQRADFSDGEWAFVTSWVPFETFKRLYPESRLVKQEKGGVSGLWSSFKDWITQEPDWVKEDGDDKSVLVCEYFYKVHETETTESIDGKRKRDRDVVTVKWAKLTGYEVLEEQDWDGKYIPLIPVVGRELQPVNGERWWVGMIRHARDAQRFFNYAASALVERMGMEPKSPWVMGEGQDEGHETEWLESNVRNRPVLHYKPTTIGDKLVPPPQRAQIDLTGMSLSAQAVQISDGWIQSNTMVYDQGLGKSAHKEESGRKVLALQGQSDASTSDFLANLSDAILYESLVTLDMIPAKYDRPGRITQILGEEDDSDTVMLNAPYVKDASGKPIPAPDGDPAFKLHDLQDRGYTTSVSVGQSFQTRLQQGQEAWQQLIPNLPPEAQILLLPTLMRFLDTPGAKDAADMLAKFRDAKFPGLADDKGQGPTPEQLQAQLEGMKLQTQQMQQMLQMAVQEIKTKQAEQEGKIRIAEIKAESDARLASAQSAHDLEMQALKNAGAVAVAETNAQAKGVQLANEARNEEIALGLEHAFASHQADKQREQAVEDRHFQAAHEAGMGAAQGNTMTRSIEGGQEQDMEQGQETSEATLPPEPPAEEATE